jgi:hypothetical protein
MRLDDRFRARRRHRRRRRGRIAFASMRVFWLAGVESSRHRSPPPDRPGRRRRSRCIPRVDVEHRGGFELGSSLRG